MKKLILLLLLSISFSAFANWELLEQADDFEEVIDYYIISDKVDPNKPMSWPHNKAKAYLYFGCQSKSMSMSVTMNNLANDDSYAGDRRRIYINVKLDGVIYKRVRVYQDFLSDFIHFSRSQTERKLLDAKELVIQLNHFGQGQRTYTFNMEGLKPLMVNQCEFVPMTWLNKNFNDDAYLGF